MAKMRRIIGRRNEITCNTEYQKRNRTTKKKKRKLRKWWNKEVDKQVTNKSEHEPESSGKY